MDAPSATHGLLRLLTCGSVDDGKSTLIGRLLYDSQLIADDTLAAITRDSRKHGTVGEEVDLALLVDGLEAERQQGITIDVAYRFFTTGQRSFIVADCPGHEQYTRNMATGASNSELAIILVDARKGLLTQTRRHSYICSLLGIRHVVLAVNKIDLVDFDRTVFERIEAAYRAFAAEFGFRTLAAIPLSGRFGDNVTHRSARTPWYAGPTLIEHLEAIDVEEDVAAQPFRFPVQWVNRPNLDFRGFSGTVASGAIACGDRVVVAGSGVASTVARIAATTTRTGLTVRCELDENIYPKAMDLCYPPPRHGRTAAPDAESPARRRSRTPPRAQTRWAGPHAAPGRRRFGSHHWRRRHKSCFSSPRSGLAGSAPTTAPTSAASRSRAGSMSASRDPQAAPR